MYLNTYINTDNSKVPVELLLDINEDPKYLKTGYVDQAICQKCLALQSGRLCAWANVPLCPGNVGPGSE